jgi:hypothetical protein
MLVNIPSKVIVEKACINDEDKEGTKEPNKIWSKPQNSRSGILTSQQLITGTRRLTSVAKELETLIPQSQCRLHLKNALPRSKRPILDMYNGHLNPRSPSSPAPIQPLKRKGNEGNRCRTQITPLLPSLTIAMEGARRSLSGRL